MPKQPAISGLREAMKKKESWRERFLAEMEAVVPWCRLLTLIAPLSEGRAEGRLRQVCRNVKRWRDANMALRWTASGMPEGAKGFRRLKAHKKLTVLKAALLKHREPGAPSDDQTAETT
jgi:hypothetical protein